jgi:hypothetical protein
MLSLFKNIAAIPIPLGEADQYHMSPDKIAEEIARGTSVILTSNPRNPTGQMVSFLSYLVFLLQCKQTIPSVIFGCDNQSVYYIEAGTSTKSFLAFAHVTNWA